jgi:transcriptional regulator GlxA family with amidase domain
MSRDDDPAALQFIKDQSAKGALIIGVCFGAKVVAETGLLDNKRATTHWFALQELRKKHPTMQYVADRRLVVDHGVATTTGSTASIPMSLTLIEAIGGRDKAAAVARDIGLDYWTHVMQATRSSSRDHSP